MELSREFIIPFILDPHDRGAVETGAQTFHRGVQKEERGEVGALLRREGLYSSHIAAWRSARDRGDLARLEPKKRGPKAKFVDARDKENADLRRQVARLEKRVAQTEALIEIQKKVAALLGNPIPESDEKS